MILLVVFIPLIVSIFILLFGFNFGNKANAIITIFFLFLIFLISVFYFYEVIFCNSTISIMLYC